MTTLAEQITADLATMFDTDEFAQVVTYTAGSTASSITGIVDYGEVSGENAWGATITVKVSDVPSPGYRHTFTIDGATWYVAMENSRPKIKGDGYVWTIDLTRDERSDAWRTLTP